MRDGAATAPGAGEDRKVRGFYDGVLSAAELVEAARSPEIGEEMALLRRKLIALLEARPEDYELMLKSIGMIARLAAVRYRMSDKRTDQMAGALAAVLDTVGEALGVTDP